MSENQSLSKRVRFPLQRKFVLGFTTLILLLSALLAWLGSEGYRKALEDQCAWAGNSLARSIAVLIDGDKALEYAETLEADSEWNRMYEYFEYVMEREGIDYVYVVIPGEEGITYVWDVPKAGEIGAPLGEFEEYWNEAEQFGFSVLAAGEPIDDVIITNSAEFGYLASCYAPVFTSDGKAVALVGVDISMEFINAKAREYTIRLVALSSSMIILFMVLYLVYISRRIVRPVKLLSSNVSAFAQSDDSLNYKPLTLRGHDEIDALSHSCDKMVSDIHRFIHNLARITAEKERISAELDVAHTIQISMLPSIFPAFPERREFDIFASMTPAREVGGDFYDFFMLDDDRLAIVIADVSGKGVPAALFMVIAKTLIKNHAQNGESPAEVFTSVNNQLCENNEAGMFVTALLAILNLKTGVLTYANAGHNPPLIKRADAGYEYLRMRPGFVLAGMENIAYRQAETVLAPGDRFFMYTDGVTEALDTNQTLYGEARLLECLNASDANNPSMRDLTACVKLSIDEFAAGAEQADDITMLSLAFIAVKD